MSFEELPHEEQIRRLGAVAREAAERFEGVDSPEVTLLAYRENAVFEVKNAGGERFALRVHQEGYHDAGELRSELAWMTALREAGIGTPVHVSGHDSEGVQTVQSPEMDGPRHCTLFRWLEGKAAAELGDPTEPFETVGAISARMHAQGRSWRPPSNFKRWTVEPRTMFGEEGVWGDYRPLAILTPEQLALLDEAAEKVTASLAGFDRSPQCFGLIHGDLMANNIYLNNGEVTLIDFDDCGYGWYLYDLATAMWEQFLDGNAAKRIEERWLKGYTSVTPVPDDDLAIIPTLIMSRYLSFTGWMHKRREHEMAKAFTEILAVSSCSYARGYLDKD